MYGRRILVDLDVIFDTRLGLLREKYPSIYFKVDLEIYKKRISEVMFSMLGVPNWESLWANRDVGCLRHSMPTEFLYSELRRVLMGEISAIEMSSPTDMPELTFNVYPYAMSVPEMGAMRDSLKEEFVGFEVKVGRWDAKSLTPVSLRSNWDAWFTYDWYRWLDVNAVNLKNRIPNFIIYRPALLFGEMNAEASDLIKRDSINPFTESKKFLAEYVTVEALDVGLFSAADAIAKSRAAFDGQRP